MSVVQCKRDVVERGRWDCNFGGTKTVWKCMITYRIFDTLIHHSFPDLSWFQTTPVGTYQKKKKKKPCDTRTTTTRMPARWLNSGLVSSDCKPLLCFPLALLSFVMFVARYRVSLTERTSHHFNYNETTWPHPQPSHSNFCFAPLNLHFRLSIARFLLDKCLNFVLNEEGRPPWAAPNSTPK